MSAAPLLHIRDLHVTYSTSWADVPAVRGLNLRLDSGETLGIAGESGCGKSTVAMAVLRLLPRRTRIEGELLLNGRDVLTMNWGEVRAVRWTGAAIIFQGAQHALNPVHRVGKQIAEPIELHQKRSGSDVEAMVSDLLGQVGLPAWRAHNYPHELSGGQRQRVMIAMALACDPELIIADEATTALDVMVQAQVLTLLKDLVQQRDAGLLMISHDLSVLAEVCDRALVMYAGQMVETGGALSLFDHPRHPYSDALGSAFPVIGDPEARHSPRGLPGDPPVPGALPSGCSFHPRCAVARKSCAEVAPELLPVSVPGDARSSTSQRETAPRLSACWVAQDGERIRPSRNETSTTTQEEGIR